MRETILADPSLGPAFFKLALSDALSYDAKTNKGGPDGSVLAAVATPVGEVGLAPPLERVESEREEG